MKVATWNLEWAKLGTTRHNRALEQLEEVNADVVVTTEDLVHDWQAYPHRIDGGHDWLYQVPDPRRRKVIAWSKEPWTDVFHVSDRGPAGRYVRARTMGVTVHAVCLAWRDSHVRTGLMDREPWQDHLACINALGDSLADQPGPAIVAGDFNQRFPRLGQPHEVHDALIRALNGLTVTTANHVERDKYGDRSLIDHVAVRDLERVGDVHSWPNELDDLYLSDHSGVAVELGS